MDAEQTAAACHSAAVEHLEMVLAEMSPPFGILLEHQYPMGVSQLNGFDAILFSAARQLQKVHVHLLPIVILSHSTVYYDEEDKGSESYVCSCRTAIIMVTNMRIVTNPRSMHLPPSMWTTS
jgi:hypothetical protein